MIYPWSGNVIAGSRTFPTVSPVQLLRRLAARLLICAPLAAASAAPAMAADWLDGSFLRGSFAAFDVRPARWDGVLLGATVGASNMSADFGNGTSSEIAYILRNSTLEDEFHPSSWTTLPKTVTNSQQWGAFLGYNWQMDQLVLGADVAYNRPSSLNSQATDTLERLASTSDGVDHDVTLQGTVSLKLVDYATVRGRAGYAVGQFLPYAMLGVAVGRFNYSTSVTVTDVQTIGGVVQPAFVQSGSAAQDNVYTGGFLAGLGVDVAVLPNVFLRAEWEYIAWGPVNGIKSTLNTGRAGIGVRF
jgi:outer membrane immunogenic protein